MTVLIYWQKTLIPQKMIGEPCVPRINVENGIKLELVLE
jgi:hypothetical protein